MLAQDIGTTGQLDGRTENKMASAAHSMRRHKTYTQEM